MNRPVIVLGSGGHAKVLIEILKILKINIVGITESDQTKMGTTIEGVPVLGPDAVVFSYSPDSVMLVNGLGTVKSTVHRKSIFDQFRSLGYSFKSVFHPSAIISSNTEIAEGVQIMAGAIIQPGVAIGANSIINTKSSIDHDCRIGSNVHVAPGVTVSGDVLIEDGVHVGTGSTIIQGIKICRDSVIGAGSVVIYNVPEAKVVFGVPAVVYSDI